MSGCERGCMEVVRRIMGVYGDAYEWLNEHDLAFWKDCEGFDVEVLMLLVGEGLDVNGVDRHSKTLIHIACDMEKSELAKSLILCGADVNIGDNEDGFTPLFKACERGHTEIVQLLIDLGADINSVKYDEDLLLIIYENINLHLLPILRQAYIQQHILIPPQLTSFPNTNSFSSVKIESSRFLFHYVHHRMSSCQIRGYMDKRGLVLNGMRELVARFPYILGLEEDEGRVVKGEA